MIPRGRMAIGLILLLGALAFGKKHGEARLTVPGRCMKDIQFGVCETKSDGRTYCPETSFRATCVEVKKWAAPKN